MNAIVLSPHNDDETLFAGFTVMREKAHVIVCFPSVRDYGDTDTRTKESMGAVGLLGGTFEQWNVPAGDEDWLHSRLFWLAKEHPGVRAYAPASYASHPDHVLLAQAAADVFRGRLTEYHTYVAGPNRVTSDRFVQYTPAMYDKKLRALAFYQTQIQHPRARVFFGPDQKEWYGRDL